MGGGLVSPTMSEARVPSRNVIMEKEEEEDRLEEDDGGNSDAPSADIFQEARERLKDSPGLLRDELDKDFQEVLDDLMS